MSLIHNFWTKYVILLSNTFRRNGSVKIHWSFRFCGKFEQLRLSRHCKQRFKPVKKWFSKYCQNIVYLTLSFFCFQLIPKIFFSWLKLLEGQSYNWKLLEIESENLSFFFRERAVRRKNFIHIVFSFAIFFPLFKKKIAFVVNI